MKKCIVPVLSLLLAVLLAGCGAPAPSGPASVAPSLSESAASPVPQSVPDSTPSSLPADDSAAGAQPVTRGVWEDDVYHSDFTGITFTLPESWTAASDTELAEFMGVAAELLEQSELEYSPELLEQSTLYDMAAYDNASANVMVMLENLSVYPGGILMNPEAYIVSMLNGLEQAYPGVFEVGERSQQQLGGQEYTVQAVTAQNGAVQNYCIRKEKNYMVAVVITTAEGSTPMEDILAAFS